MNSNHFTREEVKEIHTNLTTTHNALRQACICLSKLPHPADTHPTRLDTPLTRADAVYWNLLQALTVIGDILTTNNTEEKEVEE